MIAIVASLRLPLPYLHLTTPHHMSRQAILMPSYNHVLSVPSPPPPATPDVLHKMARGWSLTGTQHMLASSASSASLASNVNPRVVSEMLEHSTVAITLDIYSHVLPDMQEDAAAAIAAILYG